MSMPKDNEIDYNISEWKRIGEERGYFKYFEKALQQQKHKIEEWVKENAMPPKDAGFENRNRTVNLQDLLNFLKELK